MLSRRGVGVAALCAVLLTACSGSDNNADPAASQDPGRPLQTLSADGLPADFPRDQVPVVEGEVTSVQKGSAKDPGYALAVVVDGTPSEVIADAVKLLEGAGWEHRSDGNGGLVQVLVKDGGQVVLTATASSDQTVLSYSIDISA